jgi:hypothetical protein
MLNLPTAASASFQEKLNELIVVEQRADVAIEDSLKELILFVCGT